jgi:ATP-binding cassette subfamily B protein
VVLITHRVAAASRCDQILVLDEGRIVEQGNHSSLMALGGIYAEFAAEQQRARELETLAAEEAPPFDASAASVPALSPGVPS